MTAATADATRCDASLGAPLLYVSTAAVHRTAKRDAREAKRSKPTTAASTTPATTPATTATLSDGGASDDDQSTQQRRLQHRRTEAERRKRMNDALQAMRQLTGSDERAEKSAVMTLAVQLLKRQQAEIQSLQERLRSGSPTTSARSSSSPSSVSASSFLAGATASPPFPFPMQAELGPLPCSLPDFLPELSLPLPMDGAALCAPLLDPAVAPLDLAASGLGASADERAIDLDLDVPWADLDIGGHFGSLRCPPASSDNHATSASGTLATTYLALSRSMSRSSEESNADCATGGTKLWGAGPLLALPQADLFAASSPGLATRSVFLEDLLRTAMPADPLGGLSVETAWGVILPTDQQPVRMAMDPCAVTFTARVAQQEVLQYASHNPVPMDAMCLPQRAALFIISASAIFLDCNEFMLELLQLRREQVVGRHVQSIGSCIDCQVEEPYRDQLVYGNRHTLRSVQRYLRVKSNEAVWVRKTLKRRGVIPTSALGPEVKYALGVLEPCPEPANGAYVVHDMADLCLMEGDPYSLQALTACH